MSVKQAPQPAIEFAFRLDPHSGVPVYRQLIDQVQVAIASAVLRAGDQLPTVRRVAVDLAINPNTVSRAYREMELRGILDTQQGTGTFVAANPVETTPAERHRQLTQLTTEFVARAGTAGFTVRDLQHALNHSRPQEAAETAWNAIRAVTPAAKAATHAKLLRHGSIRGLNQNGLFPRPWKPDAAALEYEEETVPAFTQLKQFNQVALAVFAACLLGGVAVARFTNLHIAWLIGAAAGIYFLFAIKIIDQWEKVAVLRFGRYRALRGPGLVVIVPIIDTLSRYVDQRVRVSTVFAESTLTRDTVPVSVDAIFFWLVWNAEKSILEVENFTDAITLSAQTALRESIGRHDLAQMVAERDLMGHELQKILDEKMTPWGITVQSVEIRDVRIPPSLENAMSQQAQAERERQARVILGEAEVQVSEKFAEASRVYENNPGALHLRGMNMLYEAMRDKGSMVIVPSSAIDCMGLGGTLATAAVAKLQP